MAALSVLSMGWGKQTWAMAAMMALGELPRTDYLVFADTGHEHQATYDFIRHWTPWLGEHGLNHIIVQGKRTDVVVQEWSNSVLIPAFTVETISGKEGQLKRQCTHDWKIMPIRRFVRAELERRGLHRSPGSVEMQMGISFDECQRIHSSDVSYITNAYPLAERHLTRLGCIQWLESHSLPVPPKSACTFCPFKSERSWGELKRRGGADWREAVEVDRLIRDRRPLWGPLYIHPGRKPLADAVTIPEDDGLQQGLLEGFEAVCDGGHCGV